MGAIIIGDMTLGNKIKKAVGEEFSKHRSIWDL